MSDFCSYDGKEIWGLMEVREMGEVTVAGDRYRKDHSRDGESLAPRKERMGVQGSQNSIGMGSYRPEKSEIE